MKQLTTLCGDIIINTPKILVSLPGLLTGHRIAPRARYDVPLLSDGVVQSCQKILKISPLLWCEPFLCRCLEAAGVLFAVVGEQLQLGIRILLGRDQTGELLRGFVRTALYQVEHRL